MIRRIPVKLRPTTIGLLLSAATLLTPAVLPAQFATFVAPRKGAADSAKRSVVAVAKARADSASRMSLTEMKTWVDSAAGTSKPTLSATDTTIMSTDTLLAPTPSATPRTTTTFSNGAIAPNTATSLPTLLVVGLLSLTAGIALLRVRRRAS
jgi:hypothetical protein